MLSTAKLILAVSTFASLGLSAPQWGTGASFAGPVVGGLEIIQAGVSTMHLSIGKSHLTNLVIGKGKDAQGSGRGYWHQSPMVSRRFWRTQSPGLTTHR